MALSERRAKAVFDYLVGQGITATRMTHKGYGETKPLFPNATEAGRAKNRRTVFVVSRINGMENAMHRAPLKNPA